MSRLLVESSWLCLKAERLFEHYLGYGNPDHYPEVASFYYQENIFWAARLILEY